MTSGEPLNPAPNCQYVQLLAHEINDTHDFITEFSERHERDVAFLDGLAYALGALEDEISERVLTQSFLRDRDPTPGEISTLEHLQGKWRASNEKMEAMRSTLESPEDSGSVAFFTERQDRMYAQLDQHTRRWHRFGNEQCYKEETDDVAPIVVAVRATRIAYDLLKSKTK